MYTALMILLIAVGVWLAISGYWAGKTLHLVAGVLLAVGTGLFFWFMGFWGEMLWFDALGYGKRFWQVFLVRVSAGAVFLLFSAAAVFLLTMGFSRQKRAIRYTAIVLGAAAGMNWGITNWEILLKFFHAAPTELEEPIFHHRVGFYLFTLPLLQGLETLFFLLALISLAAVAADSYLDVNKESFTLQPEGDNDRIGALYRVAGVFLLVLAFSMLLKRYNLMYSEMGAITGPGWTDVQVRLPAMGFMIAVQLAAAVVLLVPRLRQVFRGLLKKLPGKLIGGGSFTHAPALVAMAAIVLGLQFVFLTVIPEIFQSLRVEPNEITFEKPYISHNIKYTRHGFKLHDVEEKEYPAEDSFTPEMVENNRAIFSNIRLWDWRALDAVYKQFQEIRLYYEFDDVDIDRYTIDGEYKQVMVSAREMELDNLPAQSQTFVNRRFKYTHGYGITMTGVSEFTDQGLPDLLIRDIPPQSESSELKVDRPELYYGELTRTPALVNTEEKEFDYPKGEENAYVRYGGSGGVVMENLWRKFLFGWKYDGLRLLLSGYPTEESRIMFHRQIEERAGILAPFLEFDDDPYIVLSEGKLYWIMDGYTTSRFYPYSERFVPESGVHPMSEEARIFRTDKLGRFRGSNYVRNSVKAVIDAFNGSVEFYVFDEEDPLIRTWQRVFPDMFKSQQEMTAPLRRHIRYPIDMLLLQGMIYAKYHMTDPTVFYNQEDLWVRATEKYYDRVQPVEPYYIMWERPESDHPEYVLMMPFTPKNRQVSIGWIAGMCDGENYGNFLAYKFPKEKRILGPQQVETKIDQDRFLSGQLTLWDQRGSRVIRGNVLAIPVEQTLLYVEPIYLQAETAAYPELRLVALMHNDKLSYGESFEEALQGVFGEKKTKPAGVKASTTPGHSVDELIQSANRSFDEYLKAMGEKRYGAATDSLQQLESILNRLAGEERERP